MCPPGYPTSAWCTPPVKAGLKWSGWANESNEVLGLRGSWAITIPFYECDTNWPDDIMWPDVQVKPPESRSRRGSRALRACFVRVPQGCRTLSGKVLRCNLEISGSLFFFSKPFYSPIALLSMYIIYIYVWKHCDLIEYPGAAYAVFQFHSPKYWAGSLHTMCPFVLLLTDCRCPLQCMTLRLKSMIYVMNLGGTETTRENISSECDMMKNM